MKTDIDVQNYRKEITLSLVEKYKSLISDVLEIFDENIKEDEDGEEKEESEQKKLERIKKRGTALDQVDVFLTKIESLEHHLKESEESDKKGEAPVKKEEQGYQHPTKARAKN